MVIGFRSGISISISDILLYSPSLYSRGCYILLRRYIYLYFQPHCTACRLLVPRPGIKPMLLALEAQCLKQWTSRKVPVLHPSQQGSWGWHILLLVMPPNSAWLDHGVRSKASGHHWSLSHACPVYDFLIPTCYPGSPCTYPHVQWECASKPRHMLHPRTDTNEPGSLFNL